MSDQPVTKVEQPVAKVEQPTAKVEQPVATVEQPVATVEQHEAVYSLEFLIAHSREAFNVLPGVLRGAMVYVNKKQATKAEAQEALKQYLAHEVR